MVLDILLHGYYLGHGINCLYFCLKFLLLLAIVI
jgi:hypothetical protein